MIGNVGVGGANPIRIQSMTTTDTMDTKASVQQAMRMIDEGCELVRFTTPSIREARNLVEIKSQLIKNGYNSPLIADIHFTPNAAIEAAKIVQKVRINPGNFSDKKKFQLNVYSKNEYQEELKRIEEKLYPLIATCKQYNTAMRIGTNHGSLSDRIMSYYGDTPLGMVESALEFVRICEKYNYNQIILSMKASNPIVMIQAYRLLVNRMQQEDMIYPLHLGVTEAGEGDDGRVKSAIGIGSLLMDGIGDTIRVSLTEMPEKEIPVAKDIVDYINTKKSHNQIKTIKKIPIKPFVYSKRKTSSLMNIGAKNKPIVMAACSFKKEFNYDSLRPFGYTYLSKLDKWSVGETACDYIFVGDNDINFILPGSLGIIYNYKKWIQHKKGYPLLSCDEYLKKDLVSNKMNFIYVCLNTLSKKIIDKLKKDSTAVILIDTYNNNGLAEQRSIFVELINNNITRPVIIRRVYKDISRNKLQIHSSIDLGGLLLDGLGDGIFISVKKCGNDEQIKKISFDILQSTRTRISKTEYISCPSCGRTQFDLEKTTAKIRQHTSHLKGLKIGVMGCIVNGPGEMADADYGYVGTGPGRISLYKQKEVVKRNVPTANALEELIDLIKANGDWVSP